MADLPIFGIDWDGVEISDFYQPSCAEFAHELADARRKQYNVRESTPMPAGWELVLGKHLKLELPRGQIPRFRRIYGYIGTAQMAESEGTLTYVCFQIVIKLNFRYGAIVNNGCVFVLQYS